ncbi:hypothetical protein A3G55_04055 [Candidatus Giovannonibacteria bacterium RIFCSPLOWO2_12_FULL_44_25]|uniref:Uncharacterized protein n=1 Tax=Candidatus Giovannonibacteria bacterium RIFCSPHIGHO2_02_FULL_45_40 TaxID=1798337 RepID=A0A1F5W6X5_9BACT|nr:MAG: hypothetical protein A2120_01340 [Candidatus Giovannonibacteria bacterium GWA2_45_15]OGF59389.1 MAG: hypothetical protein A2W40_02440 [Candidatus Giovannonibacteria bacterium RIFCSPHIGHO2_01_45_12]OGF60195.1 MAG: hypothetical protein A2656_00020 [Candidatus Giovannonibacteria bacterium RIFCSPHIGHO2_01_FULL_44_100]OGF71436.1 MAG: hypothetical protein A3C05_01535 [Candidatus Giovannonibacteria bacterium RIFCSPHIGHO2_02_FULL_45_40]OGF83663.1 MAG: hypothetical protein A3E63_01200 [Candidatu
MVTVTIPKKEYEELVDKRLRYDYLRQLMEQNIFAAPPTKNIKEIMFSLEATKKYNKKFLASLKRGFKRSSYFRT